MVDRQEPALPPLYRASRLGTAAVSPERALHRQALEAPDGTLIWSDAQGRLSLALLLVPDEGFEQSAPVAIAAAVALGDAIGALAPPILAVNNLWPDRLEVNGGQVGGIALDRVGPDPRAPLRLILRAELSVAPRSGPEPGHRPELTSLVEEGCDITPVQLLESFARHFLYWLHRWDADGFEPLRSAWRVRGPRVGTPLTIAFGQEVLEGRFSDLGPAAELILERDGAEVRLALGQALAAGPSWRLP